MANKPKLQLLVFPGPRKKKKARPKTGRIILNWNTEHKPLMQIEGRVARAEALWMLEWARTQIMLEAMDE